jgi:RHS repeat-associated protein
MVDGKLVSEPADYIHQQGWVLIATSYVYDGFGDKIQVASPDTKTTVNLYDADGNLTQSTNASGAIAKHTYDVIDRVLTTTYPNDAAENVAYTYDQPGHGFGIGHLTSVKDAAGTLSRTYDDRGNLLTDSRVHGAVLLKTTNTYDSASRIASITYPSGTFVSYTRDSMGRIIGVGAKLPGASSLAAVASAIAYEPFGPVDALTNGNGVKETSAFDLDYRLTTLSDQGKALVQQLVYGYDHANNVLSIQDKVTAANNQTFAYDHLNRLTSASGAYGSQSWTYDPAGNRLSQKASAVTTTYGYALGSNRLASITTGGTLETIGTSAAGEITSFSPAFNGVTSLTYNQADRLAATNAGNSQLTQYTYDGFGQRIVKVGSATATSLFQYDQGGHLLEQTDGTGSVQVDYMYIGDRPLATFQPSSNKIAFLHDDRLGTPQLATDSAQAVAWSANYQPFGYTSTGIGVILQDLRLPGQEFEVETRWNHNGFRDYAPTLGRYLEADPIGIGGGARLYNRKTGKIITEDPLNWEINHYQYADNVPTVENDPLGLLGVVEGLQWRWYERAQEYADQGDLRHAKEYFLLSKAIQGERALPGPQSAISEVVDAVTDPCLSRWGRFVKIGLAVVPEIEALRSEETLSRLYEIGLTPALATHYARNLRRLLNRGKNAYDLVSGASTASEDPPQ